MSDDVQRYRKRLAPVEQAARDQPWADQRPWKARTHVGWEKELPVVDLHDLSAALARRVVQEVLQEPPATGAVVFVHGKGRHTAGPAPVLRKVVLEELRRGCGPVKGWSFRALGPARVVWISDWSRAPAAATGGGGGWWGPMLAALLLLAFLVAVARALGWIG